MQKLVVFGLLGLMILIACKKDNIDTKPAIKIKSISPMQVPGGVPLEILLSFTDKQGDLDTLFLKKKRINSFVVPVRVDSFFYLVPKFPEKTKGEIKVTLQYNEDLVAAESPRPQTDAPNGKEPDTLVFRFYIKDKAKNVSDTIYSEPVVVERQ
jgi:hypothetical protein